ncbi:hypothetical protein [Pseudoruegeria sp. SK021]|uniref:hypothetical protein n=1 Tax=Pseudoruegeria sp. SK021 TaxID=1933035 RepID=UPI000A24A47A|nr:hypothetical protein [Pseudoruegeria sp. SK021]OSP55684.1 hypothetical protein BV911_06125 [Pseudoruegeria sp. SK021]
MLLTVLHYLGFSVAIGGGTAALILMTRAGRDPATAPYLRAAIRVIAQVGIAAIAVLWLTGLSLWLGRYGGTMALGGSWHLKLAGVVTLTALALPAFVRMQMGRPLPAPWAKRVLVAQLLAAVATVAAAVATFGT